MTLLTFSRRDLLWDFGVRACRAPPSNLCCADHGECFYRQRSKKFFCILDLQNRLRKVRCKKTGVWRRSNPRLSRDLTFGQLLDNTQDAIVRLASSQSITGRMPMPRCKLNCANARCGCFNKWAERKRVMKQDFLDRFFLRAGPHFDHDL